MNYRMEATRLYRSLHGHMVTADLENADVAKIEEVLQAAQVETRTRAANLILSKLHDNHQSTAHRAVCTPCKYGLMFAELIRDGLPPMTITEEKKNG